MQDLKHKKVKTKLTSPPKPAETRGQIHKMIDELKSDEIVKKVGGRFKLTALVQKRLSELLQGGRPLIKDTEGKSMLEIVIQEILQDKIAADDGVSSSSPEDIGKN
jgi:DNA-directed RNA polymerase subunit omega